jgi:hypothetical protein
MSEVTKCVAIVTSSVVTAVMMVVAPSVSPMAMLAFGVITFIVARN